MTYGFWRLVQSILALGMCASAALWVSSCQRPQGPGDTGGPLIAASPNATLESAPESDAVAPSGEPSQPPTNVAPVFRHGTGRAPMGLDSAATYHLSEEEAVEAIKLALVEAGVPSGAATPVIARLSVPVLTHSDLLKLVPERYFGVLEPESEGRRSLVDTIQEVIHDALSEPGALEGIEVDQEARRAAEELIPAGQPPSNGEVPWQPGVKEGSYPGGTWPSIAIDLALDGSDSDGTVAFEFVSRDDWNAWSPEALEVYADTWDMALFDTALSVRTALLAAEPGGTFAVFYDPCVLLGPTDPAKSAGAPEDDAPQTQAARAHALELLKGQVTEFAEWYAGVQPKG